MEKQQGGNIKLCSSCGTTFGCQAKASEGSCWCTDFPPIFQAEESKDCLCPNCLKEAMIQKTKEYADTISPDQAVFNKAKDLPNTREIEGIDFYKEEGRIVFTAWYLLKRVTCCGNGCRHCPYGAKPV
jgi:hypothetical protein